jgi:hypothetical protein
MCVPAQSSRRALQPCGLSGDQCPVGGCDRDGRPRVTIVALRACVMITCLRSSYNHVSDRMRAVRTEYARTADLRLALQSRDSLDHTAPPFGAQPCYAVGPAPCCGFRKSTSFSSVGGVLRRAEALLLSGGQSARSPPFLPSLTRPGPASFLRAVVCHLFGQRVRLAASPQCLYG